MSNKLSVDEYVLVFIIPFGLYSINEALNAFISMISSDSDR